MCSKQFVTVSRTMAIGLLLLTFAAAQWPSATANAAATDPIAHDPTMIRQGQYYYVIITGDAGKPHTYLPIKRSTDLIHWEELGPVFSDPPQWVVYTLGITPRDFWAPDINYFNGKYYLYYAASQFGVNNSVIGLATNATLDPNSPNYHWVDEGMVFRSQPGESFNAIDPDVTLDQAGVPWLAFGSFWAGILMNNCQKFRFVPTTDGWTQIQNRNQPGGQPGKFVDANPPCGPADGANIRLWAPSAERCQQFRLQPAGDVLLVNANSGKVLDVAGCGKADGMNVIQRSRRDSDCQLWRFTHTDNGYHKIVNQRSGKQISVAGCNDQGTNIVLGQASSDDTCAQWRLEPLNDGTFRLVSRDNQQVVGVEDCSTADGANIEREDWADSTCQRFKIVVP
jgi:arabinan endo-1,5-alpha-L-arabinosidase